MTKQINVCRYCSSANIHRTIPGSPSGDADHRWRCYDCDRRFDDAARREREGRTGFSGDVADLLAADPDEVTADD